MSLPVKVLYVTIWGKFTLYKYLSCWIITVSINQCLNYPIKKSEWGVELGLKIIKIVGRGCVSEEFQLWGREGGGGVEKFQLWPCRKVYM